LKNGSEAIPGMKATVIEDSAAQAELVMIIETPSASALNTERVRAIVVTLPSDLTMLLMSEIDLINVAQSSWVVKRRRWNLAIPKNPYKLCA